MRRALVPVLCCGLVAVASAAQIDFEGLVRLSRLADVDGDGTVEVVLLCAQPGWDPAAPDVTARRDRLLVYRAEGGKLKPSAMIPLPRLASGFDALDVTGDGRPELLVVTSRGVEMVDGSGELTMLHPDPFLFDARSVVDLPLAADIDGDGHLDLALPTRSGVLYRLWRPDVPILEGPGMELPIKAVTVGSGAPTVLARLVQEGAPPSLSFMRHLPQVQDVDGDGGPDAVLPLSRRLARFEGVLVHPASDDGTFAAKGRPIELAVAESEVLSATNEIALGDVDGDGIMEIAILTYDLGSVGITQTQRLRIFSFLPGFVPKSEPMLDVETKSNLWEPSRVWLGDLDQDGRGDVLVTHIGGLRKTAFTAELYQPKNGRFKRREQTLKIDQDEDINRGALLPPVDLDGDGRADFVVVGKQVVYLLRGVGGNDVFSKTPLRRVSIPEADQILDVLVDERPRGPSVLYVVARLEDASNRIVRVNPTRRP